MLFQMLFLAEQWIKSLRFSEEEGQGLVEYALIILLIAVAVIAVVTLLGGTIQNVFQDIVGGLE